MRIYLIVLSSFLVASCANVVKPSGGEIDKTPPVIVKSEPPLRSINFNEKGFTVEFDELITLENVNQQLVVSPILNEKPKVSYMRKKLNVSFKDEVLKENTTYTFNFGKAIVDFNEGNPLVNFSYVFSTGDYIDSLSVEGSVKDAFEGSPVEGMVVLLYRDNVDSLPMTVLPNYFGISDENGAFSIQNIKEGEYKVFALLDMNQNYLFDRPDEMIAFFDEPIRVDSNYVGLHLKSFVEEIDDQYISKTEDSEYGRLLIVLRKGMNDPKLEFMGVVKPEAFELRYSANKDSLEIWIDDFEAEYKLRLSDGEYADTIDVKVTPIFSMEEEVKFKMRSNVKDKIDQDQSLLLTFENPIKEWNPKFMQLYEDSLEVEFDAKFLDSLKTRLNIERDWKDNAKYILRVGLGSFTDYYDLTNDITEIKFGAQEESFYGKMHLDLELSDKASVYLLQLLDSEGKVISERAVYSSQMISFPYMRPEEFGLRIIKDRNGNGKWDSGNYEEGIQPEEVYYYPSPIKIRSNWEVELAWKVE